jgi:hypothetical protein
MMKCWAAILLPLGLAASPPAWAKSIAVQATLKPLPHTHSKGTGTLTGSFNQSTHQFAWNIVYQNLSSPVVSAKIHGPSHPGHDAPVILPLPPPLGSPILGVVNVTGKTSADITGGYAYAELGTDKHPAGELRGRIKRGK